MVEERLMIQSVALMFHTTLALIGISALGVFGQIDSIEEYRDTFVIHLCGSSSFAFGGFVFAGDPGAFDQDFIYCHEYGHLLQEKELGLLYLPLVALPSILYTLGITRQPYCERWANELGGY